MPAMRDLDEVPICEGVALQDFIPDVGKTSVIPKLKKWLADTPFLLCGPPGCGKKHLLHQALNGQCHHWYDLALISNNNGTIQSLLEKMENRYGGGWRIATNGLLEKTLLVLYGAEHLSDEGARFLKNKQVVLVSSERTKELEATFGSRTLWVNRLTDAEMQKFMRKRFPKLHSENLETIVSYQTATCGKHNYKLNYNSTHRVRRTSRATLISMYRMHYAKGRRRSSAIARHSGCKRTTPKWANVSKTMPALQRILFCSKTATVAQPLCIRVCA